MTRIPYELQVRHCTCKIEGEHSEIRIINGDKLRRPPIAIASDGPGPAVDFALGTALAGFLSFVLCFASAEALRSSSTWNRISALFALSLRSA